MKQQQKHYFALLYSIGLLPLVSINSREWTEKGEGSIRKFYELDLNLVFELLKDNQSEKKTFNYIPSQVHDWQVRIKQHPAQQITKFGNVLKDNTATW